jgi:Tfp pilus assembly protein FimV
MAAVIDLHTGSHVIHSVPDDVPAAAPRPQLRVLQGGRSAAGARVAPVSRRTYVLRRSLVVVAAAVVVVVAAQLIGSLAGALVGSAPSTRPASGQVRVVRSGDTLWSIARDAAPGTDPRVVVDDLLVLNGDAPLRVGQQLVLPASLG